MNQADPQSYLISIEPPMMCAAYPFADGWRARPLQATWNARPDEVVYVSLESYEKLISSLSSQSGRYLADQAKLEGVIFFLSLALAACLGFISLIAFGVL